MINLKDLSTGIDGAACFYQSLEDLVVILLALLQMLLLQRCGRLGP